MPRRNLCTNPTFRVDATGFSGYTSGLARITSDFHSGPGCLQVTPAGTPTACGFSAVGNYATAIKAVAGQAVSLRAWVKVPDTGNWRLILMRGDGGWQRVGSYFALTAGQWTEVTFDNALIGDLSTSAFTTQIQRQTGTISAPILWDDILVEVGVSSGTYFDGAMAGFHWAGAADNSVSVEDTQASASLVASASLNADAKVNKTASASIAGSSGLSARARIEVATPAPVFASRDTTSAAFDTTIRETHNLAVLVEVLESGEVVDTIDVQDGTVTLDAQASIRGRLDATVADDGTLGLVPTGPDSLLAPYGNELRVWRGVEYLSGQQELVSLGIFRIDEADVEDEPGILTVQLSAYDRAIRIAEAKFEDNYQVKPGQLFTDAILAIVQEVYPDVEYDFVGTAVTTPAVTAARGDDRWEFVQEMARAIGAELFFDGDGILVLRPVPSASGSTVANLVEGVGGVLLQAGKNWSREGIANRVIATGAGLDDNPVEGIATDDNPSSPTYYYGDFGRVPDFYDSEFLTTTTQANDAATGILQTKIGVDQQVNFGTLVDPRRQPSDVVQVTRARAGIDEQHVIDSLTIPLTAGESATGTTRKTQEFD